MRIAAGVYFERVNSARVLNDLRGDRGQDAYACPDIVHNITRAVLNLSRALVKLALLVAISLPLALTLLVAVPLIQFLLRGFNVHGTCQRQ